MGRVVHLAIAMSLVGLVGVVAWRLATQASQPLPPAAERHPISSATQPAAAQPHLIGSGTAKTGEATVCSTPIPATPTPFNGATEESPGANASAAPEAPAEVAPHDSSGDGFGADACAGGAGPTPVVPEAPVPLLLPLTATAVIVGALFLRRRHGKGGKEAADGR